MNIALKDQDGPAYGTRSKNRGITDGAFCGRGHKSPIILKELLGTFTSTPPADCLTLYVDVTSPTVEEMFMVYYQECYFSVDLNIEGGIHDVGKMSIRQSEFFSAQNLENFVIIVHDLVSYTNIRILMVGGLGPHEQHTSSFVEAEMLTLYHTLERQEIQFKLPPGHYHERN